MSELRHPSIFGDRRATSDQNAENARDAINSIAERLRARHVTITWAAVGVAGTKIPLPETKLRPYAVLLVRAYPTNDPAADISVQPRLNFYHANNGVEVYEPSGLTANTKYNLTFLILE